MVKPSGTASAQPASEDEATGEETYRQLLHALPDAFVAVDGQGCVLEWSPRAMELFGWASHEIAGKDARALNLPPAFQAGPPGLGLPVFIRPAGDLERRNLIQHIAINAAGSEFPVELSTTRLTSCESPCRFLLLIKDIGQRVIAEERLAQAAKMEAIGQMVSGLAHDFNNILGIIIGSLEAVNPQMGDPGDHEFIELAILATERGRDITRSLQAIARRQPIKPARICLNDALRELYPLLQQALAQPIQLTLIAEANHADVMIETGSFNNVVLNFVINARDAMPQGGMVMIYTQNITIRNDDPLHSVDLEPGNYVVLGVDDTGMGMPPDIAARAIEPFFTTKPKGKGTGLGLAMAYAFARQCQGALRIRSAPGQGTNIHLFIPVDHPQEA